jgi:hypothetical protein
LFYGNRFDLKIKRKNTTLQSHIFSYFEKSNVNDKTLTDHNLNLAEFDRETNILLRYYSINQKCMDIIKKYELYLTYGRSPLTVEEIISQC